MTTLSKYLSRSKIIEDISLDRPSKLLLYTLWRYLYFGMYRYNFFTQFFFYFFLQMVPDPERNPKPPIKLLSYDNISQALFTPFTSYSTRTIIIHIPP